MREAARLDQEGGSKARPGGRQHGWTRTEAAWQEKEGGNMICKICVFQALRIPQSPAPVTPKCQEVAELKNRFKLFLNGQTSKRIGQSASNLRLSGARHKLLATLGYFERSESAEPAVCGSQTPVLALWNAP